MDYQNGKIYTIRSPHTEKYYIGSTASTLVKRFSDHKTKTRNKNKKNPTTSKIIFDYGDAYIELLELFPCGSKIELNKREGELQRLHRNDIVNTKFECRTAQELKEQKKEYYSNNSDIIKEQIKEYKKINAEAIKEQKRDYYKKNIEKIREKNKKYREAKKILNEIILP